MPVSSTFRYGQTRCWNGSRFWNWTMSTDQSGTIWSASKPPWARPRKLSAVRRAFGAQLFERLRHALPEISQAVAGSLGGTPRGELGRSRQRPLEVRRVHARDDDPAHLERRIQPRQVEAMIERPGAAEQVPERWAPGCVRSG